MNLKALKKLIELTTTVCEYEIKQLQSKIDAVPDCRMHQILSLRYINGLTWNQVAASINNDLTGESVKKIHNWFLN